MKSKTDHGGLFFRLWRKLKTMMLLSIIVKIFFVLFGFGAFMSE